MPLVRAALSGHSTRIEDLPLLMTRYGIEEPTNWSFSYSPVFDDDGDIVGMMNIVVETTEAVRNREQAKQAFEEAQIQLNLQRKLEARQKALKAEMAHRMKNTLAMTQAVVSQSLRNASSTEEAAKVISGRMLALAEAQDVLVDGPSQRASIRAVLERALRPHEDRVGRFCLSGPEATLSPAQGLGLSLAVHELATNATKYGALIADEGFVEIVWTVDTANAFRLEWKERGGPAVSAPARTGFGSRLTQKIVAGYFRGSGALLYETDGVRFVLSGSLADDDIGEPSS